MRFLVRFLCVLFVYCAAVPLRAGDSALVLTLDGAVARALEYSVSLQTNRITLEDREYAAGRLWALVFPAISAGADAGYRSSLFTGVRQPVEQRFSYSTSVGLSLGFTAGLPGRMKLLGLAWERQLLTYEDARRLLEITTAQNFYALIAERENLGQLAETLSLAERQLKQHRIGRDNGLIGETALIQSQLGVETARYELSAAQAIYSANAGAFLSSLGLSPETPVELEGEFEVRRVELDAEELIRDYLPNRPDIVQQRRAIEEAELTSRQKVLDARSPSVRVSVNWGGGSGTGGITAPFTGSVSGSVSLSIPINPWIPGTNESQALRSAESEVKKARLNLKSIENQAAGQIRSLTANLRNSWESLEIARLRAQVAQQSYELTERGFLNGAVEALVLETSRKNLADARYQLLRSEFSYQKLVLDLAQAVNVDWRQFIIRSGP
ncbi:MAG: TolC family protein [Treponema sp.]|jgi:outer membrane protein TolC|nr:TolC family protein [Treponema sp.]